MRRDDQPVDLTGQGMPADQPHDRHFRLRIGAPQLGEPRIGQHRQCFAAELGLFLGG